VRNGQDLVDEAAVSLHTDRVDADVGSAFRGIAVSDRVIVPFPIACGFCYFCK